jgi:hypothetical protein
MKAGYVKRFDWSFYLSLKYPTSKRLYRFLDKRFYWSDTLTFDLTTLCHEKIGLSRNYAPRHYKHKLRPAIVELEERGYLETSRHSSRFVQTDDRYQLVVTRRRCPAVGSAGRRRCQQPVTQSSLQQMLEARGVSPGRGRTQSATLAATCEERLIRDNCKAFDALVSARHEVTPGLLVNALLNGRQLSIRGSGRGTGAETKTIVARQERRQSQASSTAQSAIQSDVHSGAAERFRAWFGQLSDAERSELLEDALAAASPFWVDVYERTKVRGGRAFYSCKATIVERHLASKNTRCK